MQIFSLMDQEFIIEENEHAKSIKRNHLLSI